MSRRGTSSSRLKIAKPYDEPARMPTAVAINTPGASSSIVSGTTSTMLTPAATQP